MSLSTGYWISLQSSAEVGTSPTTSRLPKFRNITTQGGIYLTICAGVFHCMRSQRAIPAVGSRKLKELEANQIKWPEFWDSKVKWGQWTWSKFSDFALKRWVLWLIVLLPLTRQLPIYPDRLSQTEVSSHISIPSQSWNEMLGRVVIQLGLRAHWAPWLTGCKDVLD